MEWAEVASHILLRSCSVCLNQSLFVTKASWYHKEKQAFTTLAFYFFSYRESVFAPKSH